MTRRYVKYVYTPDLVYEADTNPTYKGRASLTHDLISVYDLIPQMLPLRAQVCKLANMTCFHTREYIRQLEKFSYPACTKVGSSDNEFDYMCPSVAENFGLGYDCPTWPRLKDYVYHVAGGTMTGCTALLHSGARSDLHDIIINWTGGWHHAQAEKAAGFCYINDVVLGLIVLRKVYRRILYLDLDVHHGDAVQEAFLKTKRVFTVSFHKYECGYYPGTGGVKECGYGSARGYCVNFPYKHGISGPKFKKYFHRIMPQILEMYQPDACMIQCGADAIVGDPLGGTNLTPADLIDCVQLIINQNLPTMIVGGGGYNPTNASRYWTLLTAALCGRTLNEDIPVDCQRFLDYGPDYCLRINARKMIKDENTEEYLENCANIIEANLKNFKVSAIE